MKVYEINRRGELHAEHCEDALWTWRGEDVFVGAIFDGCSGGDDSFFASKLFANCFRRVVGGVVVGDDLLAYGRELFRCALAEVVGVGERLCLKTSELLATMVVAVVLPKARRVAIVVVGDGFYAVDGVGVEVNQDNRPDYVAYHFDEFKANDGFERWWLSDSVLKVTFEGVGDVSICSDGILSAKRRVEGSCVGEPLPDVVSYFLFDNWLIGNVSMLPRKCNLLRSKFGLVFLDDLSIVRVVL